MTSEANTEDDLEVDPGSNLKMAEDSGLEADSITDQDRDQDEHEQAKIEAWLDEHPEFFQEYLIRKGKLLWQLHKPQNFIKKLIKNQSKFEFEYHPIRKQYFESADMTRKETFKQVLHCKGQTISKANYGFLNFPKKRTKLTILSKEDVQNSEFCSFFAIVEKTTNCF